MSAASSGARLRTGLGARKESSDDTDWKLGQDMSVQDDESLVRVDMHGVGTGDGKS